MPVRPCPKSAETRLHQTVSEPDGPDRESPPGARPDSATAAQDAGPGRMDRKRFLHLGATGLAALGGTSLPAAPLAGPRPSPPRSGLRQEARPQEAPPVGDLVDPAAVPSETWLEPWIWRPADWQGEDLTLDVVQHQNPGPAPSPGNPFPTLFSYNGKTPAPTIRARGDETVGIRLRNHLDTDHQLTPVGPAPDLIDIVPADLARVCELAVEEEGITLREQGLPCIPFLLPDQAYQVIPARRVPGYALAGHANGQRTAHVTNLHFHGLHVPPNLNPDGTLSDHVMLRVIPHGDWRIRQASDDPVLRRLKDHERTGRAEYRIRLGEARHGAPTGSPRQPHPPGTHWYHPHAHGSTHDQVASGMAGFLIIEGDVDDAVNRVLTGTDRPHPEERTGPWDYRERLIFIQRVFLGSIDMDAGPRRRQLRFPPPLAVNGVRPPNVFFMRPGAVERWRVLNGSVDGSGFKRFMVLEGQYVHKEGRLWRVEEGEASRTLVPVTRQEVARAKLPLWLLAFDGITLVTEEDGRPRHTLRDLSLVNAGTLNPLDRPPAPGEAEAAATHRNIVDAFRDGDSLRRCFNRPNEVYLANANRADVFFKAPLDSAGKVFTIFAQEVNVHTDNFQQQLQNTLHAGEPVARRPPMDVVAGYIHVRGEPVDGGDFDVMSLRDELPDVPPFLHPVREEELRTSVAEAAARGVPSGSARTRVLAYSGTGGADWPLIRVPESFAAAHPELEKLVWARHDGVAVLLPNYTRTMGIHSRFDLAADPDPGPSVKFAPQDETRPRVLAGSAEEWVLYNTSSMLWGHTDTERFPQQGQWGLHYESWPLSRAEGQAQFAADSEFQITTKGSDHPFHIHINPMWVIRIDVPDENGDLHNILDEPRWMDTVPIPRNGGRVVFRSRFLDFTGRWVHHCHILLHEDNGMMQTIECTDRASDADPNPRSRVASHDMPGSQVDRIYPKPSPELMYRQNLGFVDPSPDTGQVYPGFEIDVPERVEDR